MGRVLMLTCVVALAASCSSTSKSAGGAASTTVADTTTTVPSMASVHGKWVNAIPAVSLGNTAQGFKQRSGTTWTGDLVGTTTYVAYTRSDPKHPRAGLGNITEVFTGTVRGIGSGRLYLNERFTVAATGGAIRNVGTIEQGAGGLTGVTGTLVFIGTLDMNADGSAAVSGMGHGTYTGTIGR